MVITRERRSSPQQPSLRSVLNAVTTLLLVAAIGFGVVAIAGPPASPPISTDAMGLVFEIPYGSTQRVVPEFMSAIFIPTVITFREGDIAAITIINKDTVRHRAGPFYVDAGQTFTQRFPNPGVFEIVCTTNHGEDVTVIVEG